MYRSMERNFGIFNTNSLQLGPLPVLLSTFLPLLLIFPLLLSNCVRKKKLGTNRQQGIVEPRESTIPPMAPNPSVSPFPEKKFDKSPTPTASPVPEGKKNKEKSTENKTENSSRMNEPKEKEKDPSSVEPSSVEPSGGPSVPPTPRERLKMATQTPSVMPQKMKAKKKKKEKEKKTKQEEKEDNENEEKEPNPMELSPDYATFKKILCNDYSSIGKKRSEEKRGKPQAKTADSQKILSNRSGRKEPTKPDEEEKPAPNEINVEVKSTPTKEKQIVKQKPKLKEEFMESQREDDTLICVRTISDEKVIPKPKKKK